MWIKIEKIERERERERKRERERDRERERERERVHVSHQTQPARNGSRIQGGGKLGTPSTQKIPRPTPWLP